MKNIEAVSTVRFGSILDIRTLNLKQNSNFTTASKQFSKTSYNNASTN
jgi:hypothetical protein